MRHIDKFKDLYFSSKTDDWATPQYFFDKYNSAFHFTLDVAASDTNAKCSNYYTLDDDALTRKWEGICWCNPPYGRFIGAWVKKAYESSLEGATVVCLIPSRTCTTWWHDYVMRGDIEFIRGRLKFGGSPHNAPFPSAIVIFKPILIKQPTENHNER